MRSMWKGAVSFGLVSIPINLYAATESHDVTFRQVHREDGGRIQYRRVCTVDGQEVPYSEIGKGFETPEGEMVVLTEDDLAGLPLPSVRGIEVLEFVPLEAIDPISFERSYYLEPQQAAVKPYVLLRDALHKSGRVAIAKIALRQRESLAVLRVYTDVLVLTTMLWPDEVRKPDFAFLREQAPEVRQQELSMASSLIDSMSDEVFDPGEYHDEYREALTALIAAKVTGREVTTPPVSVLGSEPVDLMSALRASVDEAKKAKATGKAPAKSGSETKPATNAGGSKAASRTAQKTAPKTAPKKVKATTSTPSRRRGSRRSDGS